MSSSDSYQNAEIEYDDHLVFSHFLGVNISRITFMFHPQEENQCSLQFDSLGNTIILDAVKLEYFKKVNNGNEYNYDNYDENNNDE